jgi:hypothetical protein
LPNCEDIKVFLLLFVREKKKELLFLKKKKQKDFPLINQAARACTTHCLSA